MGVEVTLHWTDVYSPEHKIINEFTGLRENEDVEIPVMERGTRPVMDYNWWGHSTVAMPNVDFQGIENRMQSEYEIITGDAD